MKKMTANFYPAKGDNRLLGFADLTIANAVRINGIRVFRAEEGPKINIVFPGFGEKGSYVVPKTPEVYAEMRDVIAMAAASDKGFGYNRGEYGVRLDASGKAVSEPFADGRFSIDIEDVCTLHGITTRPVEFSKDGKDRKFTAVDFPSIGSWEKDGEKQYRYAFEGRTSSWEDKDGKEHSFDYGQLMQGLVMAERKELLKDRKPGLDGQIKDAAEKKAPAENVKKNEFEPER